MGGVRGWKEGGVGPAYCLVSLLVLRIYREEFVGSLAELWGSWTPMRGEGTDRGGEMLVAGRLRR